MHPFIEEALKKGSEPNREYLKLLIAMDKEKGHTPNNNSVYHEIARLELEIGPASEENLKKSMETIYKRTDCYDFILPGFIFLMFKYSGSPFLSDAIKQEMKDLILGSKYWIDEGGFENGPCYFTENHQILFHSNEYMAGQLYPDEIFINNNKKGRWHMEHARPFILRWLEWRFKFGFSEWLSNNYYHEDILALANLAVLCNDKEIMRKANMVIDLLFFDMALHTFKGVFGSTHGRAYVREIIGINDSSGVLRSLFLHTGSQPMRFSPAAVLLAVSGYRAKDAIRKIALDESNKEMKQCTSISPEEGREFGADPRDMDNVTLYWGIEAFSHRLVVDNTLSVKCEPGYYLMERAKAYKENFLLCDAANLHTEDDADYTSMTKANLYTYKTKDYMLSCAVDFKKGKFGFQQHIWQASLGGNAIVFTNHPASREYNDRPNWWAGNRILPKAVAYKNVVICMYNTPVSIVPSFTFNTHAYFPQGFMDEVTEKNGWFFGRKDEGYISIRPLSGFVSWADPDPSLYAFMGLEKDADVKPYEINATGRSNVWVCELGSKEDDGSFLQFVEKMSVSNFSGDVFNVTFDSPSQGRMIAGWNLPLKVKGIEVMKGDFKRYENPFCKAERGTRQMDIAYGNDSLELIFE
jgi:hypothetical protein